MPRPSRPCPRPRRAQAVLLLVLAISLTGCTGLKRFAYEGFGRDEWQQPDRVIEVLGIERGSSVADLGSGGGYFTFRLADAVGVTGRVYAVDVDLGLLEYIDTESRRREQTQVQTVAAAPDNPGIASDGVDLLFTCNTYHHLPSDRVSYFRNAQKSLRPGARIAIIDFRPSGGWLGGGAHASAADTIVEEMQAAGYELRERHDFLERQNFLVFGLPED